MFCWRSGVPGSSAAALEPLKHLQSTCQGSKLVNCPPGPIPNPPPASSLILGFSPSRPEGTVPQRMRSIVPAPVKTKIILFSFHPISLDPEAKQERSGGSSGHESSPALPQPHSAAQTGGPGHEPDLPSSRTPGPCRLLHIHRFLTCLSQQRPTVPCWMPRGYEPQSACSLDQHPTSGCTHMLPSEVPAHLKPALRTVVAHAHPSSHPSESWKH